MQKTQLSCLVDSILEETRASSNPFFLALRDGTFAKDDFIETQVQFFWAVVFFSRPMAALAAKIPTPELRLEIVRNVWEEHGEGDFKRIHGGTFLELMSRLGGLSLEDINSRALWPELRTFNTMLSGVCVLDEYLVGVGLMGMIERMFSEISAWIGQSIVDRGWLSRDQMIHYCLHEKLDIKHSQDFFDVLENAWDRSPENRYAIEQGLRLGTFIFNRLYEDLYRARKRRVFRETRGMHSRAEG
jgi:pyrroloquinoline-quinone synthase